MDPSTLLVDRLSARSWQALLALHCSVSNQYSALPKRMAQCLMYAGGSDALPTWQGMDSHASATTMSGCLQLYATTVHHWRDSRNRLLTQISQWRIQRPMLSYSAPRLCCGIPLFTNQVLEARTNARIALDISPSWFGLVWTVADVAEQCDAMIERFTFAWTKAVASQGVVLSTLEPAMLSARIRAEVAATRLRPLVRQWLQPFYHAHARLNIFFPDRKLVQFDSGKLQRLDKLLRELKNGGHKCLLFTQMSKMLDILEIFLNLHGHTYVRLDGSTSIEMRQRLMDRFNTDPKLFCFLLSTRSGGSASQSTPLTYFIHTHRVGDQSHRS